MDEPSSPIWLAHLKRQRKLRAWMARPPAAAELAELAAQRELWSRQYTDAELATMGCRRSSPENAARYHEGPLIWPEEPQDPNDYPPAETSTLVLQG